MDWFLTYRTAARLLDVFSSVPEAAIAAQELHVEPNDNILFITVARC
jgi:hypothetical protein